MLKVNVLLNCEYYFTPLNAEGGSSFLGVTAVQGLTQDGDYLSVVRSRTNADQAVRMFAITDEGPVEVSSQLATSANMGQPYPGLPQVAHDVATDAVSQRFSVVAGHAPLTTLVEEGANQLGSCGDNVCAVGEFTRLYACVSDCHAFYVSFYFVFGEGHDAVLASPGMLEVELRQSAVGQDTAITSVPFQGGVAFTVVASVERRAQEIEAALEAGEVLVLGAGASRGPAPVVDGGGGGKSSRPKTSVIVVYVVLAVCITGIAGLATNSARRRHAASRALENGEDEYVGKRSKVRTAVPITFDTRDDVPKGLLSETFLRAATEALQRGEDPADILTAALTSVPCSSLYEQALVCIAVGDMESLSRVLTQAMQFGGPTGVQRLVQSAPAEGRNTLLMHAVQLLSMDALTLLLSTGASVHSRNMRGQTALHLVAQRSEPLAAYLASILLEHGADVNAEDEQGLTPLLLAARFGSASLLGQLLERNAHIDAESLEGRSVVTMAVLSSNQEAVQALLAHLDRTDHRLLLDKQDEDGWAPLHWACAIGEPTTLELLLEQPTINVYTQTRIGETPLHVAAREGNIEVVSMLLSIRPPRAPSQLLTLILQETDAGMTAEQLAEASLHSDCAQLISQQKRQLRTILAASGAGSGAEGGVCTVVGSLVETGGASSPSLSVSTRSDSAHGGTAASATEDSSSPLSVSVGAAAAAADPSGTKNVRGTKATAAAATTAKAGSESKSEARRRRRRDAWRRRNEVKRRNQTETEETVAHLEAEEQLLQQVVSALVADRQRLMRALGIESRAADPGRVGHGAMHMPLFNDRSPDSGMDEDLVSQRSIPLLVSTPQQQFASTSTRITTDVESYV
jgi:ankyrin repeat protein